MPQILLFSLGIVAAVTATALVFVLAGRIGTGKRRRMIMNLYNHLVVQHSLHIHHKELVSDKLLAIDADKKLFVYIQNTGKLRGQLIRITDVVQCKIVRSGIGTVETKENGSVASEKHDHDFSLVLVLKNRSVIDLPFYNQMRDGISQLDRLTEMGLAWERRINIMISKRKPFVMK